MSFYCHLCTVILRIPRCSFKEAGGWDGSDWQAIYRSYFFIRWTWTWTGIWIWNYSTRRQLKMYFHPLLSPLFI